LWDTVEVDQDNLNLKDLQHTPYSHDRPIKVTILKNIYTMYLEKMGMVFGCVFAPVKVREWSGQVATKGVSERPSRLPPAADRILEAFLFLSKELNRNVQEENLVPLFIRIYQDLFPGRLLCIKLFDQETMGFEQVYANGRLREESHSRVRITKKTQKAVGLTDEASVRFLEKAKIVTTYEYLPIFEDGLTGFDIPLYDGANFYGLINFEYWKNENLLPLDRAIAVPIAHQMCTSLRHTQLISETTLLKDYMEKLLDQANAPMVVINRERRITVFNQASERQTGYSRVELLGNDLIDIFAPEDKERLSGILTRVMLGEQRSAVEVRVPHADGEQEARFVLNMAPINSGGDELDGVILVGQDLTEIRDLQKQIIHTEKLATVGQIAAGVAHEVSNPLTSVSVYANYLLKKLEGEIDESDLEKIKRIVEASLRIQAFTRELVTYGRPSRDKAVLLEVRPLLEWAISFCEHLIDRAGAHVVLDVEEGLKRIFGIRGNLEQVFVNLITNACHAVQASGGTIHFEASTLDRKWIAIAVSDTGHGIPADRLEKVFEPFYSTKPEGLGTGLGLSIVRNILTEHKAEIAVESEPGVKTTFTLKFPAK
jgi:PAS domain S-box-containing protein